MLEEAHLGDWDREQSQNAALVDLEALPALGLSLSGVVAGMAATFSRLRPESLIRPGSPYLTGHGVPIGDWLYTFAHAHEICEVAVPLAGTVDLLLGDQYYTISPGQVAFVASGELHNEMASHRSKPYRLCWIRVKPGTAYVWISEYTVGRETKLAVSHERRVAGVDDELILRTEIECAEQKPQYEEAAVAYLTAFYFTLMRAMDRREPGGVPIVEAVSEIIEEHFHETLSVQTIAHALAMNSAYVCSAFKRHTGKTIGAYITTIRVHHAMTLLRSTELPVGVVAERCGFNDPYRFSKVFRQETGGTPSSFRKSFRHNAS